MKKNHTFLWIFIFLFSLTISVSAQKEGDQEPLGRGITIQERIELEKIRSKFVPTEAPQAPVRQTAEFERMQSVLIAYPFGISTALIAEMSENTNVTTMISSASEESAVVAQYTNAGVNLDNCTFAVINHDSYWTRDYGPWYIVDGNNEVGIVDFVYNRPRPNDNNVPIGMGTFLNMDVYNMSLVTAGGNYMTDGLGISASSDLILEENSQLTEAQIHAMVEEYLGIHTYHIQPDPNNTYIDHIDCWGKFLDVDKILIRQVPTSHPQYDEIEATAAYWEDKVTSWGNTFQVYRVYTPNDQPYTNSLILNEKVFVPITGSQWDDEAIATYQQAMPGYEVLGFTGSWESTDALHCRTRGIIDAEMLWIKHTPYLGNVSMENNYPVEVEIISYGNHAITSAQIYYSVNGGEFISSPLQYVSDNTYSGTIPAATQGSEIAYYIEAADASGRVETHPFIGQPDPHVFYIGQQAFAHISLSTDAIVENIYQNTTSTVEMEIGNTGQIELNYSITTNTAVYQNHSYAIENSPAPNAYNGNTYTEANWEDFSVDATGNIAGIAITYSWNTDNYPAEGSLWLETPSGNRTAIANGQSDGNYTIETDELNGFEANGNWKIWIEDSYSDGGHQATNINITITTATEVYSWLNVLPVNGIIQPSESEIINVNLNANNLELGQYTGKIIITSNDPDNSEIEIPVTISVTENNQTLVEQQVTIPAGWSGLSSYLNIQDTNVENIFLPINESMIAVQSQNGIYYPENNENTINTWERNKGYIIKTNAATNFTFTGYENSNRTVTVAEGWNLIPVFSECDVEITNLIDNRNSEAIYLIKEIGSKNIFSIEEGIEDLSTIESGKAYFVKANSASEIVFPTCPVAANIDNAVSNLQHNWNEVAPTGSSHVFIFEANSLSDFTDGDFIGVFNNAGICGGCAEIKTNAPFTVVAFGDDFTTNEIDGFIENDELSFQIFRSATQEIIGRLEIIFDTNYNNQNIYANNGISKIEDVNILPDGINDNSNTSFSVYPNPSSGRFSIKIFESTEQNEILEIYNICGMLVFSQNLKNTVENIDLQPLETGIYMVKVKNSNKQFVKKLIIE